MSRLTITRNEKHQKVPLNSEATDLGDLIKRLDALTYDGFHHDIQDDVLEVETGHRWTPPFDELLQISHDFHVDIRCLYDEPGCCFMGAWKAENGTVTQDDSVDY